VYPATRRPDATVVLAGLSERERATTYGRATMVAR